MGSKQYLTPYLVYVAASDPHFMGCVRPFIASHLREYRRDWAEQALIRNPYLESFPPYQVEQNWHAATFLLEATDKKAVAILLKCFPQLKQAFAQCTFAGYCEANGFIGLTEQEEMREAALYLYCLELRFQRDGAAEDERLRQICQLIAKEVSWGTGRYPDVMPYVPLESRAFYRTLRDKCTDETWKTLRENPETRRVLEEIGKISATNTEFALRLLREKMRNQAMEEKLIQLREESEAKSQRKLRSSKSSQEILQKQYETSQQQYLLLSQQYARLAAQVREMRARQQGRLADSRFYAERQFEDGTVLFGGTIHWAKRFSELHSNVTIYVGEGDFPADAIHPKVPLVLINLENLPQPTLYRIKKLLLKNKVPHEFILQQPERR